jgi:hypothetical protein
MKVTQIVVVCFVYVLMFDRDVLLYRGMVLPSRSLGGKIANLNEEDVS